MTGSVKFSLSIFLLALAATFVFTGNPVAYGADPISQKTANDSRQPSADTQPQSLNSPDDTISLTGPAANTTIAETDDYATQVLNDPWDLTTSAAGDLRNLEGLDDIDQPYGFSAPDVSNGIWSAVTTLAGGNSMAFQYQNFDNAYSSLGEKDGHNNPIDATRFNRFLVRLYSDQSFPATVYWYKNYVYTPDGNSNIFTVQPGWHIYSVDLRPGGGGGSGTWSQQGPYWGFMLQAIQGVTGNHIMVDWARLTPDTGATVRITWNYTGTGSSLVHLYLSTSADPNSDNEIEVGSVAASAGAFSWSTTGVTPGAYYIHASFNGAVSSIGPLVVNTAPIARIDAPSPDSGEDYSFAHRNEAWNGSNPNQFQRVVNIANLVFGALELRGNPTNNDPQLNYVNLDSINPIDTARYRYFSQRMEIEPPPGRADSPFNAGPRLYWDDGSHNMATSFMVLWPYRRYEQRYWDLPAMPMINGTWSGQAITLRMDPLEEDDSYGRPGAIPASFGLTNAHLTSRPIAGRTGEASSGLYGTIIRWTTMQGAGTISLYRDTNNSGYDGVAIATGLPLSQGSYAWSTAAVPAGTYYVYAIVDDGTNSSRSYSLAPVVVDQSQPATLFTDVPNNYWAVDYINRLAMGSIVGGTSQPDATVNFRPAETATRAQLSKIVVLAAGLTLLNPTDNTFHDVAVGSTFFRYIETAAANNIINGYDCGGSGEPCDPQARRYFRPNRNVTRGQTAKMVTVSRNWPVITPTTPTFHDVPYDGTPGSLYSYIETAAARNVISGYPCGSPGEPCDPQSHRYFRPGLSVTRAQLSKMVSTALDSQ